MRRPRAAIRRRRTAYGIAREPDVLEPRHERRPELGGSLSGAARDAEHAVTYVGISDAGTVPRG
jgi:hypothetical protein